MVGEQREKRGMPRDAVRLILTEGHGGMQEGGGRMTWWMRNKRKIFFTCWLFEKPTVFS